MTPYAFFYAKAGYSYDPSTETKVQGRARGAKALARAESMARDSGLRFVWSIDPDIDASEFSDNNYPLYQCFMVRGENEILQSFGGVDFGETGQPWGDSYSRVVEAELALEHFSSIV